MDKQDKKAAPAFQVHSQHNEGERREKRLCGEFGELTAKTARFEEYLRGNTRTVLMRVE